MTTAPTPSARRLNRERDGLPARPIRIAHLGAGNFFRAHQAWYTEHSGDAAEWGIAAFAGRGGLGIRDLTDQEGLYTLTVRGEDQDRTEVVSAITTASADLNQWRRCFANPELAVVTITVTEAGYRRGPDGGLDHTDPEIVADLAALREHGTDAEVATAPGKLALGLAVRYAARLPGLTVVPCDNIPGNGTVLARVTGELASATGLGHAGWIADQVPFVTTMVDRITPRTTEHDSAELLTRTGVNDPAAVVTEPYAEWVLAGEFPAGRPRWEDAGARFVDDITPWEQRKLYLLNGSHSLMAYAAAPRGHETVDQAVSDPVVRAWVGHWWDDAAQHLPMPTAEIVAYRDALLRRYANPRIRHLLTQIATDGSQKLPIRILPVIRADLARDRVPTGAARVLAAWVRHLRDPGAQVTDVAAEEYTALAAGDLTNAVHRVLGRLGADDQRLRAAVTALTRELGG